MNAILETPPLVEPVSLVDAKLHLKVDTDADDTLISNLIVTARQHIETMTQSVLINQTWRIYFDRWSPDNQMLLPVRPITSVILLKTFSDQDVPSTIDPSHYYADLVSSSPKLILRSSRTWAKPQRVANGIEIEVIAGFGSSASDVPHPLKQAVLILLAHWYENRQIECAGLPAKDLGSALQSLLRPYKVARL